MNQWLLISLMAVAQGVTEFLPVSSSGHLAVLGRIFGFDSEASLSLGIMLHAGSLLAIAAFYFKTLWGFFRRDQLSLLGMVIVGSIPAAVAGVTLKHFELDERLFGDPLIVGFAFLITGAVLRLTGKPNLIARAGAPVELRKISLRRAIIVGLAQMFAIIPGLSRSGSTIAAGILCGIERESAATFSFLLALPAIAGAGGLELVRLIRKGESGQCFPPLQLGFAVALSAAVSFVALAVLVKVVKRGKLSSFSWYLFCAGAAVLFWQIKIRMG